MVGVPVVSKKNRLKFGRGRAYKPGEVVRFETALRGAALARCSEPLRGDLHLAIEVTVPNRVRRDLQNFSDTVCDALNGALYADDSQITELHMRKIWGKRWGLKVVVEPARGGPEEREDARTAVG